MREKTEQLAPSAPNVQHGTGQPAQQRHVRALFLGDVVRASPKSLLEEAVDAGRQRRRRVCAGFTRGGRSRSGARAGFKDRQPRILDRRSTFPLRDRALRQPQQLSLNSLELLLELAEPRLPGIPVSFQQISQVADRLEHEGVEGGLVSPEKSQCAKQEPLGARQTNGGRDRRSDVLERTIEGDPDFLLFGPAQLGPDGRRRRGLRDRGADLFHELTGQVALRGHWKMRIRGWHS